MKITKYAHACVALEDEAARLVIDPGSFTTLPELTGVVAVILTHEHPDHAGTDNLQALQEANPGAPILGPEGAAQALPAVEVQVVQPGTNGRLGPFDVTFGGGRHAPIHHSIPQVDNLTVQVGEDFYHPGDSLEAPTEPVAVLAAPISGPWLKLGEVMDYVLAAQASRVIPIHEVHASEPGRGIVYDRLGEVAAQRGGEFMVLAPGQSLST
ncbi:MBL fold metallo-hydrolase [Pseudactinotalea sp. Z1748]|uniref:MBL fold metallo-hydrolase n=1 Tax=Pseudactinotalea sp. Z1748 TaxID=3413027 RepID=UPI003C7DD400